MKKIILTLLVLSMFILSGCSDPTQTIIVKSKSKWGTDPNTLEITETPELILNGDATVFNDMVAPITNAKIGTHAITFDENEFAYYMDDATTTVNEDYLFVALQLPHNYKQGTGIYCHLHAYEKTRSATNYTLELNYTWYNINSLTGNYGVITKNFTLNTPERNNSIIDFGLINGSGKTLSSTFKAKITRKAGDQSTQNLYIDFFDCHYQIDGLGSKQEYIK